MDDLFKLFPDLPWLPAKTIGDRLRDVRERDARVRGVRVTAGKNAARIRAAMRLRRRRVER
jgi:hypothetical protein